VSIRSGNPYRFHTIPPLTSRVRTPTRPVCSSVTRSVKKGKIIPRDLYCSGDVSSTAVGIVCFWLGAMYSRKRRCAYRYFDYSPIIFFFRLRSTNDRGRNTAYVLPIILIYSIHQYIILLSCRPPAGIQCIKNTSICRPVYEYRRVLYRNS